MADPITTDDLYGSSNGEKTPPQPPAEPVKTVSPIPIEETPEILPIPEEPGAQLKPQTQSAPATSAPPVPKPQAPATPKKRSGSCLGTFFTIVVFIALFIAGILLSSYVRQFFPNGLGGILSVFKSTANSNIAPTPTSEIANPQTASSSSDWKTYQVVSGVTKLPLTGVSFQLPPDVLPPICDGTSCSSQGTYLSGGTRFTVAPRGTGQLLPDYRGSAISDVGGIVFTAKPTTVVGHPAMEFTGTFTGHTISGYAFSQMHGDMIALTDSTSLEINHFVPSGITADFASDDAIFNKILQSLVLPTSSLTPSPTPTSVQTATSSGY